MFDFMLAVSEQSLAYAWQLQIIELVQQSFLAKGHEIWIFLRHFDTAPYYFFLAILLAATLPRQRAIFYLYLVCLIMYSNHALKEAFGMVRPSVLSPDLAYIATQSPLGFPSGTAMGSILIGMVLIQELKHKKTASVLALLYTLTVCTSRIYLGVHFITDILGGWFFSLLLIGVCHYFAKVYRRSHLTKARRWLRLGLFVAFTVLLYVVHPRGPSALMVFFAWGLAIGHIYGEAQDVQGRWLQKIVLCYLGAASILVLMAFGIPLLAYTSIFVLGLWLSWGCYVVYEKT